MTEITIKEACEIYLKRWCSYQRVENYPDTIEKICKECDLWIGTPAEEYVSSLVWRVFGETKDGESKLKSKLESLSRPVSERIAENRFYESRRNDFNQNPFYTAFERYSHQYVYVHSEIEGRFGKQFWVSVNCENGLELTYSRKQLNETLEVGKFYKIVLTDVIYFGNNRKKYVYDIEEITEEEFLYKGIRASLVD